MKRNIVYTILVSMGVVLAFYPFGGRMQEPNILELLHIESKEQPVSQRVEHSTETLKEGMVGIESYETEVKQELHIPSTEIGETAEEKEVADDETEEVKETEHKDKGDVEDTGGGREIEETSLTSESLERGHIPQQAENTSCVSQAVLDQIRSQVYQHIQGENTGISESLDLKNAAIAKLNKGGGNALEVLVAYGGKGWTSVNWQGLSAFDYTLDTTAIAIADVTNAICNNLPTFEGYSKMGVGVAVTPDDGCYKVTVELIFTD